MFSSASLVGLIPAYGAVLTLALLATRRGYVGRCQRPSMGPLYVVAARAKTSLRSVVLTSLLAGKKA